MYVVAHFVHQRADQENPQAGDARLFEVHALRLDRAHLLAAAIAHAHAQRIAERLARELDELAVRLVLDDGGARLGDRELDVLDLLDREPQPVGHRRGGEPRERHPFGARGNAEVDELGSRLLHRLVHTRAFIAASSLSKIPKIFTRPVMSKIFLICGFVQTRFTDPPCSRTRLRPPISTPRPVESI